MGINTVKEVLQIFSDTSELKQNAGRVQYCVLVNADVGYSGWGEIEISRQSSLMLDSVERTAAIASESGEMYAE